MVERSGIHKKTFAFLFCGAGLLGCFMFLFLMAPRFEYGSAAEQRPFIAMALSLMLAGLFYMGALLCLRGIPYQRSVFMYMLALGALMRGLFFFSTPILEDDFYRYLWDGGLTAHGHNPYAYIPEQVQDEAAMVPPPVLRLAGEAGITLDRVNHPRLGTIYPPVAQAFFAAGYWITPWRLLGWRLVLLLADCAVAYLLYLLLRTLGKPVLALGIYWLNPLLIKETINSAHMDIVIMLFLVLACWWMLAGKPYRTMVALALSVATKLWPIFLAPLLLRASYRNKRKLLSCSLVLMVLLGVLFLPMAATFQLKEESGVVAYGERWEMNDALYMPIEWCFKQITTTPRQARMMARVLIGGMLLVVAVVIALIPCDPEEVFSRAVVFIALLFMFSPTQFPWYYLWLLPFLVIAPRWWLLALTVMLPMYYMRFHFRHMEAVGTFDNGLVWVEYLPVWAIMLVEEPLRWKSRVRAGRQWAAEQRNQDPCTPLHNRETASIAVIIPALNEADSIGQVLADIPPWVDTVIVADNGSTDDTAAIARQAGAQVVTAPRRGYGSACLAGIAALDNPDIVVFLDGDYSDYPEQMDRLVDPLIAGDTAMVIGSRVLGQREKGALTPQARFGNWLATGLIRLFWGQRYTDLGPFRAIRYPALQALAMCDPDFGWTVEMQIKAAQQGLPAIEVPVDYRKRIGRSKISGTVKGVVLAGNKILGTIFVAVVRQ